ncbi:MAG: hypothetical protein R3Y56_05275 [Akkermansia sp.]
MKTSFHITKILKAFFRRLAALSVATTFATTTLSAAFFATAMVANTGLCMAEDATVIKRDASSSISGSANVTLGLNGTSSEDMNILFNLDIDNTLRFGAAVYVDGPNTSITGDITVSASSDYILSHSPNYRLYGVYISSGSTSIASNISVTNDYGSSFGIHTSKPSLSFTGDLSISAGTAIYYHQSDTMTWNGTGTVRLSGVIDVKAAGFEIQSGDYILCDNNASETVLIADTTNDSLTIKAGARLTLADALTVFTSNSAYSIGSSASDTSSVSLTLDVAGWTDTMSPMFSIAKDCELIGLKQINIINLGSELNDYSAYISDEGDALAGTVYYLYSGDLDSNCYAMAGEAVADRSTQSGYLYRISADYQNVESFSTDIIATTDFTDSDEKALGSALYITSDQVQKYSMGTLNSDVSMSASHAGASNAAYGVYVYGKVGEIAGNISVTSDGGKTIGLNMSHFDSSGANSVGTLSGNVTASGGASNIAINNDRDSDLSFADGVTITAGAGTSSNGNFYTNSGSYALMSSTDFTLSTQSADDTVSIVGDIIMSDGTQKATVNLTLDSGIYKISNNHADLGTTIAVSELSINAGSQLILTKDTQFIALKSSTTLGTVSLVLNAGDSTTSLLSITGDCSSVTGLDNGIKLYTTKQITDTSPYIDDANNALAGVSIYLYQAGESEAYGLTQDLTVTSRDTVAALYTNTSDEGLSYSLSLISDINFTDSSQKAAGIYNTGSMGTISSDMYLTSDSRNTGTYLYAIYNDGGTIDSIQGCTLSVKGTGGANLYAIENDDRGTIGSISNVTLDLSSSQQTINAILLKNSEITSITNSSITVSSGSFAYGIKADESSSIGSISGLTMDISSTSSVDAAYGININESSIGSISGSITVKANDEAYGIRLISGTAPLNFADTTTISATGADENYALYSSGDVKLTSLAADGTLANATVSLTGDIYVRQGDLSISSGEYKMLAGATITADNMSIGSDASLTLVGDMVLDVDSLTLNIADLSTLGTLLDLESVTALTTELDTITISLSGDDYKDWKSTYLDTLIRDSNGYLDSMTYLITNGADTTHYGYVDATDIMLPSSALLTITDKEDVKLNDSIEAVIDYDSKGGDVGAGLFNNASSINLIKGDISVTTIQSNDKATGNTVYGLYNTGYIQDIYDHNANIVLIEGDITVIGDDVNATGLHSGDLSNVGRIAGNITVTGNLTNYALFLNFDEDIQFDDGATLSATGGTRNYAIGSTNELTVSTKGVNDEVLLTGDISIADSTSRKNLSFESGNYFLTGNITAADLSLDSGVSMTLQKNTTFNVDSLTLNVGSTTNTLLTVADGMTVTGLDSVKIVVDSEGTLDYSPYIKDGGGSLSHITYYFYEKGASDAYGLAKCIEAGVLYEDANAIKWTANGGSLDLSVQTTAIFHEASINSGHNEVVTALYNSTTTTLDSLKGDWSVALDTASANRANTIEVVHNEGTITSISAKLTGTNDSSEVFVIDNRGTITSIDGSTIKTTNELLSCGIYSTGTSASIGSISNTSVIAESDSGEAVGIRNYSGSSITSISGSSFTLEGASATGIGNTNGSAISSLNDVTLTATATGGIAYGISNGRDATMGSISGSISAIGTSSSYAFYNKSSAQTALSFSGDTTLSASGASEGNNYAIDSSSALELTGAGATISLKGDVASAGALSFTSGTYTWTEQADASGNSLKTMVSADAMTIGADASLELCDNTKISVSSLTIDISGSADVSILKNLLMLTDDTSMTIANKTITVLVDATTYAAFAADTDYALELIYDDDLDSTLWGDDGTYQYIISNGTETKVVDYDQIAYGFPFIYATEGWAIDEPYATKLDDTTFDGTSYATQLDESISFAKQTGTVNYSGAAIYNEADLSALTGSIKLADDSSKGGSESEYNFAYGVYSLGDIASMEATIEVTNTIGNAIGLYNEGTLNVNTDSISASGSLTSCAIWNNSEETLNFAKSITLSATGGSTANYAIYSDSDLTMTSAGTVTMQGDLSAGSNSITLSSGSYEFDNGNTTTTITAGDMSIATGSQLSLSGDTNFAFSKGTLTLNVDDINTVGTLLSIADNKTVTGLDTVNVVLNSTDYANLTIESELSFIRDTSDALANTSYYLYNTSLSSSEVTLKDTAYANATLGAGESASLVTTGTTGTNLTLNFLSTLNFTNMGKATALYNTGTLGEISGDFVVTGEQNAASINNFGYAIYNVGTTGDVTGDMSITNNYGSATAIYNEGSMGDIEGRISATSQSAEATAVDISDTTTIGTISGTLSAQGVTTATAINYAGTDALNFGASTSLSATGATNNYAINSVESLTMNSTGTVSMSGDVNSGGAITLSSGDYTMNAASSFSATNMVITSGASLSLNDNTNFKLTNGTLTLDLTGASSLTDVLLNIKQGVVVTGLDTINVILSNADFDTWDINSKLSFIDDLGDALKDTSYYIYDGVLGSEDVYLVDTAYAQWNTDFTQGENASLITTDSAGKDLTMDFLSTLNFTSTGYATALYNTGTLGEISGDFVIISEDTTDSSDRGYAIYNVGTTGALTGSINITNTDGAATAIYNTGSMGNISGDSITVSGTTAYGLDIVSGASLGELSSNLSVTATNGAAYGVRLNGEMGSIISKTITVNAASLAYGVYGYGTLDGDISSSFDVDSSSSSAYGLSVSGTITGDFTGSMDVCSKSSLAYAISLSGSMGNIAGKGITVSGTTAFGLDIGTSASAGELSSNLSVTSTDAYAYGVHLYGEMGGISSDSITVNATTTAWGLLSQGGSTLDGDISSFFDVDSSANEAYGLSVSGTITGDFTGSMDVSSQSYGAYGIKIYGSMGNIAGKGITVSGTTAYGLDIETGASIGELSSNLNVTTSNGEAYGVRLYGEMGGISSDSITVNAASLAYGVYGYGTLDGDISSSFDVDSSSGEAYGLYLIDTMAGDFTGSMDVCSQSAIAYGISLHSSMGDIAGDSITVSGETTAYGLCFSLNASSDEVSSKTIKVNATGLANGAYIDGTIKGDISSIFDVDSDTGDAYGLQVNGTVTGKFTGSMDVYSQSSFAYGIHLSGSIGDIAGDGITVSGGTTAYGLYIASGASAGELSSNINISGSTGFGIYLYGELAGISSDTITVKDVVNGSGLVSGAGSMITGDISSDFVVETSSVTAKGIQLDGELKGDITGKFDIDSIAPCLGISIAGTMTGDIKSADLSLDAGQYAIGVSIGGTLDGSIDSSLTVNAGSGNGGNGFGLDIWGTMTGDFSGSIDASSAKSNAIGIKLSGSMGDIAGNISAIAPNEAATAVEISDTASVGTIAGTLSAVGMTTATAISYAGTAALNFGTSTTLSATGATCNYAINSVNSLTVCSTGTVDMTGDLNSGGDITLFSGDYSMSSSTISATSMNISTDSSLTLNGDTNFILSNGTLTLYVDDLNHVSLDIDAATSLTGLDSIKIILDETLYGNWTIDSELSFIKDSSDLLADITYYIYSADLSGDYLIVDTAFADTNGDATDSSSSVVVTPSDDSVSGNDDLQDIFSTLDYTTSGEAAALSNTGDMGTINSDITADASSAADSGDKGYGVYNTGTIDTIDASVTITGGQNIYAYYTTAADTDLTFTDGALLSATGAAISNYAVYAEGDMSLSTATDSDLVSMTGDVYSAGNLSFESGSYDVKGDVSAEGLTLNKASQIAISGTATVSQLTGGSDASISGNFAIIGSSAQNYESLYEGSYANNTTVTVADGAMATLVTGDKLSLVLKAGSTTTLTADSKGVYKLDGINSNKASAISTGTSSSYTLNLAGDITQTVQLATASDLSQASINFEVSADTMLSGTPLVVTTGAAVNFDKATVNISMDSADGAVDVSKMQSTGNTLLMLSDKSGSTYADLSINTDGAGWSKYFTNITTADGVVYADLNRSAYSGLVIGNGNDGDGATLLGAALIDVNPQLASNKEGNEDLAAVLDSMDGYAKVGDRDSASRLAAAIAGASITSLNSALMSDVERQLGSIRNRLQDGSMALSIEGTTCSTWIQAESASSRMDDSNSGYHAGHDYKANGGSIGIDTMVGDNTRMGMAFTAMYGDVDNYVAGQAKGNLDNYYFSLYARHESGAWEHRLVGSLGLVDASMDRTITHSTGSYKTKGETDGTAFGLGYELAYAIELNEEKTSTLSPIISASFIHSSLDDYTEKGSDATLRVSGQNNSYLTLGVGAQFDHEFGSSLFNRAATVSARALLTADIGHRGAEADVCLTSNPATVTRITGTDPGTMGLKLGIGFNLPINEKGDAVFLNVNYDIRSELTEGSASLGYRFSF